MLEKDSVVSSISECEVLAWVWIWSVMLRRAEDLDEREDRSVEFCLCGVRFFSSKGVLQGGGTYSSRE